MPLADVHRELAMINKGNVLQYKDNSANITRSQKYSLIAKGAWSRKKAWASQTQIYTNPNINNFQRVNYFGLINVDPNKHKEGLNACQSGVIPDGGNLNARVIVNPCTGQVVKTFKSQFCFPTTASDVPGPVELLCYNNNIQTWYPKPRRYMNSTTDSFPEGYKNFVSANAIPATR